MYTDLIEVKGLFDKIANTSGKNDKIKIIKQNKNNELFVECLKFLLDSDIVTGLSKKKINKKVKLDEVTKTNNIRYIFNYLKRNNTGKDEDIATVQAFTYCMDEDLREFCNGLFTKSLKVGVDVKGLNKAIPNAVITHDIQLAGKWEGNELKKEVAVSLKLDGIRCSFLIEDNTIIAKTRQNKTIENMDILEKELLKIYKDKSIFLDGELLAINEEELDSKDLFKKTSQIVNSKGNKDGLTFVAFDILPLEDYKNKISNIPFKERRKLLEDTIGDNYYIKIAPLYFTTKDANDIRKKLDEVIELGLEGLMLNDLNGKYKFGRNRDGLLKVKKFYTMDLKIVGFEEGQGKNKDTLGAILVDFKGNIVKVGSGLGDNDRVEIWSNQDKYLGRILEVSYFEVTKDKTGKESLRFPTFVRVREDGKEVSYE